MALDKTSMKDKIKAKMAAITPQQISGNGSAEAYRDALLEAMCDGIIEEIVQNAVVTTTSGAPNGEHTGIVT